MFTKILCFRIQQDSSVFIFFGKKISSTVQDRFYAPDRKFWWEHLLHIFACMHTYYNLCVRDIPLLEQKNHTIFMYQKKKDKKQLVSKRDGAQSNNPVLQCLDFGCTHGLRKPSALPLQVFRWPKKGPLLIQRSRPSGIHRNLKQKKINSREGFFRKSPFCTFSSINPGYGGPWDILWIIFLIAIFILLQKNAFGQKKI